MGSYPRPEQLDQALDALSQRALAIVAGGTDFYPAWVGRPLDDDVLDISATPRRRRTACARRS